MWIAKTAGMVFLLSGIGQFSAIAQMQVQVRVTQEVIQPKFGGVGFHADFSLPSSTPEHFDQVLAKRWRELQPSFARVSHWWRRPDSTSPWRIQGHCSRPFRKSQSALNSLGMGIDRHLCRRREII
jgi:hypothetical protein